MKTSSDIRKDFLQYFKQRGHTIVESSSLIPQKDPTLLFTNAGMVQFKEVFLGREKRDYTRAASSQKCMRAGGKHNDLENVGHTARHHTFFEMLGNFSFGDYFKEEAILMAWEFLTQVLGLSEKKLWVSVYKEDEQSYRIWKEQVGVASERIVFMDEKDNFWAMGDTGPCGPCSEIIIDQGEECGCGRETCRVGCDCDRYLELWNLVFMQFNRNTEGKKTPLPKPSIDTGMGLERITAVVQGVKNNYDTDLFIPIIRFIEQISQKVYGGDATDDISIRIIADHSRAVAFLIADGILPSNEGRGYVLRRIMRRAARHGRLLGLKEPFLHKSIRVVAEEMQGAYPEILQSQEYITKAVLNEEENFSATLEVGLRILQEEIERLKEENCPTIPGQIVFKLYDTYGFPADLTADIASEHNMHIDKKGFKREMEEQRKRARKAWKGSGEEAVLAIYRDIAKQGVSVTFNGYDTIKTSAVILQLIKGGKVVDRAVQGDDVELITSKTCFYGESGGQVGDRGTITSEGGVVEVVDTLRPLPQLFVHRGTVRRGEVKKRDTVELCVDAQSRRSTANNHTATHILHATLRQVLGNHVKQAGSLVTPERLRFDFTHFEPLKPGDIEEIETMVNDRVLENTPVTISVLSMKEAMQRGATALFGEKYGDTVRVVNIADYSMELCGGTHIHATGEIGIFKIISEGSVAAGVRRIEALTGKGALQFIKKEEDIIRGLTAVLKTDPDGILSRVEQLFSEQKNMERQIAALKGQLIARQTGNITDELREICGIKVIVKSFQGEDPKSLRQYGDRMKDTLKSGIIVVGSENDGKAHLLSMVTKDIAERFSAKKIIEKIAPILGGKGGGRNEMAQAGGKFPEKMKEALQKAYEVIEQMGQKS